MENSNFDLNIILISANYVYFFLSWQCSKCENCNKHSSPEITASRGIFITYLRTCGSACKASSTRCLGFNGVFSSIRSRKVSPLYIMQGKILLYQAAHFTRLFYYDNHTFNTCKSNTNICWFSVFTISARSIVFSGEIVGLPWIWNLELLAGCERHRL